MMRIGAALVGVLGLSCATEGNCTLAGCGMVALIDLGAADPAALPGATVEVCVAELCARATLPTSPPRRQQLAGDLRAHVELGTHLTVEILPSDNLEPRLGDVYTARLTGGDGAILFDASWTAGYVEYFPNGADGDPCGQACDLAVLYPD